MSSSSLLSSVWLFGASLQCAIELVGGDKKKKKTYLLNITTFPLLAILLLVRNTNLFRVSAGLKGLSELCP